MTRVRRVLHRARTPAQLGGAFVLMVAGAALIAAWAVGIVFVAAGALAVLDALLRDDSSTPRRTMSAHQDVIERWRQAR